jgi:hypothetical protein
MCTSDARKVEENNMYNEKRQLQVHTNIICKGLSKEICMSKWGMEVIQHVPAESRLRSKQR